MWRNRCKRNEDCTRYAFLSSHWVQVGNISSNLNRKKVKFSNVERAVTTQLGNEEGEILAWWSLNQRTAPGCENGFQVLQEAEWPPCPGPLSPSPGATSAPLPMAGRDEGCLTRLYIWFCDVGCGEEKESRVYGTAGACFLQMDWDQSSSCLSVQGVAQSQWRLPTVAEVGSAGRKAWRGLWELRSTASPALGILNM